MADNWMSDLAAATGLPRYPWQGPFGQNEGAVIGNNSGYLLAIGPAILQGDASVCLLLRFPLTSQIEKVRAGVEQSLAESPDVIQLAAKANTCLKSGADFIRWDWKYSPLAGAPSLGRPTPQRVAALAAALVEGARKSVTPFDGKCEICHTVSTPEVLLLDGIPGYYCAKCGQKREREGREAEAAYGAKATNAFMGVACGLTGAVLGGAAAGLLAFSVGAIFTPARVGIGWLVAVPFFKGYGKVDIFGRVIICVLTLAAIFFGDALFHTLMEAEQSFTHQGMARFVRTVTHLWELETSSPSDTAWSLAFGLGGALIFYQRRRPKLAVRFEHLGQPTP